MFVELRTIDAGFVLRYGEQRDSQRRKPRAARRAMRKHIPFSVATCNQVLDWMVTHVDALPVRYGNPNTDAKRAEQLLRRQFNYLKSKSDHAPEIRALFEQIESRTVQIVRHARKYWNGWMRMKMRSR